jgi:hypothetical protein
VDNVNDRGRVPFALVGVLLLLTASTLAVNVLPRTEQRPPDVDQAMDGATARAVTELRGAADEAATNAAIAPVLDPADTAMGRALNDSQPFRDALELRIYLRAVERLEGTETTRGDTTVSISLPSIEPTTEGYRRAIERVDVERAGEDDTALAIQIDGVELSAARDGQRVATVERSPEFIVANPVLLLHDRTERFERRANAPVTRNGLGKRLTARLYPIAWARGYAQYGGAPIATVLGTRHVELATNDALLAEQRAAFGEADPDGHRGTAAAAHRVATTDLIAGAGGGEAWQDAVLRQANETAPDPPVDNPAGAWRDEYDRPTITVGVNRSADHAFADLLGVTGEDELGDTIERVHTVEARTSATTSLRDYSRQSDGSPGGDWTLGSTRRRESTMVNTAGGRPPESTGWSTREGAVFDVTVTETTTRTWERDNETTTTRSIREHTYRVRIAAQARSKPIDGVPSGTLDGHLRAATERAVERAISDVGGFRRAAKASAHGRTVRSTATATAEPAIDRTAIESDLETLRDHTRDISVKLPAAAVGTGRSNPAAQLQKELPEPEALVDRSGKTAGGRTLRAGQLRYLDILDAELTERRSIDSDTGGGISNALGDHLDSERLDGALTAHRAATRPDPAPIDDPAGNLSFAVDTAPSYLTTSELSRDRIDERGGGTVHPLATRTVNVFTSPHGQVASGIFDRIPFLGTTRVPLSTAARTLASADGGRDRDRLEREVETATAYVRGELLAEMVDAGVPEHEARELLSPDVSTAEEALLLTDGTTVERASTAASSAVSEQRLELRLRTKLDSALEAESGRPRKDPATAVQKRVRNEYSDELEAAAADGIEAGTERARIRALGKRLGALPAGLPIAPVPGMWYATANVWYVNVTGTYERFAVRSDRGSGSGAVTYLRDGRAVEISHRGQKRHVGSADRVSVQTRTAVIVVVPPGPRGVGNTDGTMIKESPGWPS